MGKINHDNHGARSFDLESHRQDTAIALSELAERLNHGIDFDPVKVEELREALTLI